MANLTYFKGLQAAKAQFEAAGKNFEDLMYVFLTRQHWTQTDYLVNQQQVMPSTVQTQLKADSQQLLADVPPQYIVHEAWFYNRAFYVDENVLIPQFDTETLVAWVLADYPADQPLNVLDIGTGSGILAITLKLARPNWQITATDISEAALKVAAKNAKKLDAALTFKQGDLWAAVADQKFDLILSNPPYISRSEIGVMDKSVWRYEPEIALFAAENGLAFYQRFAEAVSAHLTASGQFYLEFGYQQKQALAKLFQEGLPQVSLAFKQDLAAQDRILRGKLS
ncbi:peptide chain release factor N(5)-glutamine methyltransferase [Agrilactobacillus yilanensis]|uniref:Release factor glutamine methyltransferase n=1 Tax=Agrilactobacillus yilanensis TaxID=2485997 RepID=A0ABW4J724_9LACO|nr:peptide chain release factor N(5)-glutamine methyltransferase [Agrilactobacillus yilanensis]